MFSVYFPVVIFVVISLNITWTYKGSTAHKENSHSSMRMSSGGDKI